MNNTILILGTNSGQLDLIKTMKELGWYVIGCSNRSDEVGVKYTDKFYEVDIRDIEAVSKIAVDNDVNLVYSVSSDTAIKSVVQVSSKLNLPTFYSEELIRLLDNKQDLRSFLNNIDLSIVNYVEVDAIDDSNKWNTFPCIVKPSNAQGQRGVKKVDNAYELKNSVINAKQFSSNNTAVIEDFLDGVEISCNVLVSEGQIVFDILSERLIYNDEYFGIPKGHLIPCVNIDEDTKKKAVELVSNVVKALEIENGPLYFQMKATTNGVKIIEIAPRLDGCHMWRLIQHATNRSFLVETIEVLLNKHQSMQRVKLKDNKYYELIFQHSQPSQTFEEERFPIPVDALYHEYRYSNGEAINIINGKKEVVGYYVAEFPKDKWEDE
ncbi:ATPase [Psychrobacter sp. Choline-02u-13]|uniref:ATP-grasp domain-containing protein n=1 Tax=unclassified Psychrobacter TaxID=196806 RepID=UPI000C7D3893|nr:MULTISPECIES: ATP-grasp domain-containing protein [unclassified Psychrobacter]PKG64333.1 ATPase [Psychrobacter sp. Choline-02u-13]PKH53374.1 ATPase [Psychrobacter sp. Choline-02u-9]